MHWITFTWSAVAAAYLIFGVIHLTIWVRLRQRPDHLVFAICAISASVIAFCELGVMHASSPRAFGEWVRWSHIPLFVLITSLVAFVRVYFKAGRPWLAGAAVGLRLLSLLLNFVSPVNINYASIYQLVPFEGPGGERIVIASGAPNPLIWIAQASSVFLLVFVVDAAISIWRRGERRRAIMVGGSLAAFVVIAAAHSALVFAGLVRTPFFVSFPFAGFVLAMGYELSRDLLREAS